VSGSGISWAICKSAPWPRQITMPASHHSVFYRLDALPAIQPTVSKHNLCVCVCVCVRVWVCVCECVCVCVLTEPLASPCDGRTHQSSRIFPAIGLWVCSLETWDDGAQCLLELKISLRRLGGQPAVGASAQSVVLTASHSSFIEVPSTGLQVCVYSSLVNFRVTRQKLTKFLPYADA